MKEFKLKRQQLQCLFASLVLGCDAVTINAEAMHKVSGLECRLHSFDVQPTPSAQDAVVKCMNWQHAVDDGHSEEEKGLPGLHFLLGASPAGTSRSWACRTGSAHPCPDSPQAAS